MSERTDVVSCVANDEQKLHRVAVRNPFNENINNRSLTTRLE